MSFADCRRAASGLVRRNSAVDGSSVAESETELRRAIRWNCWREIDYIVLTYLLGCTIQITNQEVDESGTKDVQPK
jgi:hypothetical protein